MGGSSEFCLKLSRRSPLSVAIVWRSTCCDCFNRGNLTEKVLYCRLASEGCVIITHLTIGNKRIEQYRNADKNVVFIITMSDNLNHAIFAPELKCQNAFRQP